MVLIGYVSYSPVTFDTLVKALSSIVIQQCTTIIVWLPVMKSLIGWLENMSLTVTFNRFLFLRKCNVPLHGQAGSGENSGKFPRENAATAVADRTGGSKRAKQH